MARDILALDALDLRDAIASGALRAAEVSAAYCARIADQDPQINAWAWHDPGYAHAQAAELDRYRHSGRPLGALHGVPVGLKDVIDTARIPTENGSVLDAGRVPERDAVVVARLKAEGAVILGKTVTTPLQFLDPGPTRNPRNPAHTPGGSSSGSAAAVAAAMVPLAIGTQTGGSVIRPASYCGITGFKPTFGAIPRSGILEQSRSLDTLGVFARTPRDAALLGEVLFGHDPDDPATAPAPRPDLLGIASRPPPVPPTLAFVRPPGWEQAHPDLHSAFADLQNHLGDRMFEVALPEVFAQAARQHRIINLAEMAKAYFRYGRQRDQLGAKLGAALQDGEGIPARDYLAALDWKPVLYAGLGEIFTRCDAIVTPAAPGPAPHGLSSTGDASFNALWTLLGTPAVTVPLLSAANALPMGVQLVGPRHGDGRLLRLAHWLCEEIAQGET